jgi:hypothetical protein
MHRVRHARTTRQQRRRSSAYHLRGAREAARREAKAGGGPQARARAQPRTAASGSAEPQPAARRVRILLARGSRKGGRGWRRRRRRAANNAAGNERYWTGVRFAGARVAALPASSRRSLVAAAVRVRVCKHAVDLLLRRPAQQRFLGLATQAQCTHAGACRCRKQRTSLVWCRFCRLVPPKNSPSIHWPSS